MSRLVDLGNYAFTPFPQSALCVVPTAGVNFCAPIDTNPNRAEPLGEADGTFPKPIYQFLTKALLLWFGPYWDA